MVDKSEGKMISQYICSGTQTYTTQTLKNAPKEIQSIIIPTQEASENPNAKVTISELDFRLNRESSDCYIYCLSNSNEKIFGGYDSCIEITDIDSFKFILRDNLRKMYPSMHVVSEKIRYHEDKLFDTRLNVDPVFIKDSKYSNEKEFRLSFRTDQELNLPLQPVKFCDDRLIKCVKQIF